MKFTRKSKVLVQGIAEPKGLVHAAFMKAYGTNIVAGVSPGYGGQTLEGIPVFDLVEQATDTINEIETSIIFVPPYQVLDAACEAIAADIRQIIIITAGVPPLDMVKLVRQAEATETLVVGPNCPGIIVPDQVLLGTHPPSLCKPGSIGIISSSGSLTYEVAQELTQAGLGQSIIVGIGCDAIVGSSFSQWLQILDEDDNTEAIVVVGEASSDGGEELAARYITEAIDKPVVAYLAGQYVPIEKPRSHASTLLASRVIAKAVKEGITKPKEFDTVERKLIAFKESKIPLAERPSEIVKLLNKVLPSKPKKA